MVSAPAIFRFVSEGAPERHLEAAAYLGADTNDAAASDSSEILAETLIRLMRESDAPNGLSAVGFKPQDTVKLAKSSIRQTRAIHNAPRIATIEDMENIYSSSMSYWP